MITRFPLILGYFSGNAPKPNFENDKALTAVAAPTIASMILGSAFMSTIRSGSETMVMAVSSFQD